LSKGENFIAKVKSVDIEGRAVKINRIDFSINKRTWIKNKRKEVDGGYYYKWEEKLEKIIEKKINTDRQGNWQDEFAMSEEGEFRIIVKAADSRGNTVTGTYDIYVYGEARLGIRPSNDDTLEVITNKADMEAGDWAEIIIKSPYPKAKALIAVERGKIFDYKVVNIEQTLYNYEFPITEEYIPNIFASVVLLSPKPEVKYGQVRFRINTNQKELNIEVKSDKKYYLPGEEVVLDIEAKDYNNNPVEAELSVAVADLSVLALKGNQKKNPLVFFYDGFPLTVTTGSNIKNILYEVDVFNETKGGGGGAEAKDLAKKKRGIFRDTAFWRAVIRTDKSGRAQESFTLPDNLTTWQIETVGLTKDIKLGVDYQEFVARKELMTVPLRPRFIVPGDEFSIGAKVFNQSGRSQRLEVSFSSSTLDYLISL